MLLYVNLELHFDQEAYSCLGKRDVKKGFWGRDLSRAKLTLLVQKMNELWSLQTRQLSYFPFHLESLEHAFSLHTTLPLSYLCHTPKTIMATGQQALSIRLGTFVSQQVQEILTELSFSYHPGVGLIKFVGNTKSGRAANVLEDKVKFKVLLI